MNLVRNHRTMGYEVARTTDADGKELAILQTSPTAQTVALAQLLMPVTRDEAAFEARMALVAAIERCRFLGVEPETIRALLDEELLRSD